VRRQVTNVVKSISGLIRDSIEVSLVVVLGMYFCCALAMLCYAVLVLHYVHIIQGRYH